MYSTELDKKRFATVGVKDILFFIQVENRWLRRLMIMIVYKNVQNNNRYQTTDENYINSGSFSRAWGDYKANMTSSGTRTTLLM